ncbi:MAG: gliding motility protein GldN [Marinilabiliales bacterium]|nr:MAG: gliding motility protein GldN [Marinilabiliales bacterium]
MKTLIFSLILFFGFGAFAQVFDAPLNNFYEDNNGENSISRVPVPYQHVRKADVFWAKRIWRVIDLREKINHPLYYPEQPTQGRISLVSVILQGIEEGSLTAYDALNDDFTERLSEDQVRNILVQTDTIRDRFDPFGNMLPDTVIEKTFQPADVTMIRIKEDWFFDKQRSVIEVRILGLCPVKEKYDANGEYQGTVPIFWVYFPEARSIFVKYEVFNRFNDGQRLSYDDWFFKRFFGSYIIKESNVYDRYITQYAQQMDALLESERIEDATFIFEHDLWEY